MLNEYRGASMLLRENTKEINIGGVKIGGTNRIAIQSMTNTFTEDVDKTVAQILRLEETGCDIVRSTVPNMRAAEAFKEIKKRQPFSMKRLDLATFIKRKMLSVYMISKLCVRI